MKLIYVDESGCTGIKSGSSPFFILCGISFDSSHWKNFYHRIKAIDDEIFKKHGQRFGEFKGSKLFAHQGGAYNLQLSQSAVQWIYGNLLSLIFDLDIHRFVVVQSKQEFLKGRPASDSLKKDFQQIVWNTFLTEIEQHLLHKFNVSKNVETGLIYMDGKPDKHIRKAVLRFARKYDSDQVQPNVGIIEAPIFVDSQMSSFIQLADILAYSVNSLHTNNLSKVSAPPIPSKVIDIIRSEIVYPLNSKALTEVRALHSI